MVICSLFLHLIRLLVNSKNFRIEFCTLFIISIQEKLTLNSIVMLEFYHWLLEDTSPFVGQYSISLFRGIDLNSHGLYLQVPLPYPPYHYRFPDRISFISLFFPRLSNIIWYNLPNHLRMIRDYKLFLKNLNLH